MPVYVLNQKGTAIDTDVEKFMTRSDGEVEERRPRRTLPAEWAPQCGVQLTWPHAGTDWAYMLEEVTETYIRMAYEIARREPLLIVTPEPSRVREILKMRLPADVQSNITLFECPTNDTWARDHGFITVVGTAGPELLDFRFNGWGGKFEATLDNAINHHLLPIEGSSVAWLKGTYTDCLDFEMEGGAIESDGNGTLLTTAECLLNTNRRHEGDAVPTIDKSQVEMLLQERLGVNRILWLHHGYLAGDDTDSHIDTLARLCPGDTIVYVKCEDTTDEHYAELNAMEQELRAFRTAEGEAYRLIPVPLPRAEYDEEGERLPATYANFLIMNNAVLLPVYDQPEHDAKAIHQMQKAFPQHEIVPINCRSLIRQHGSLHCCTMQFPRLG